MNSPLPGSFLTLLFVAFFSANAQQNQPEDQIPGDAWPEFCRRVEILSTLDGNIQPAFVYFPEEGTPRPLVVSLHTWSGDYTQEDTLARICYDRKYNYIHPDFRGPNNNPEACGSEFAIRDIEDAIAYALDKGNVDSGQIHITGTSGGGYATLLTYMNTRHPVRTFSAWVPISDLQKWYYESLGRGNRYALEIARSTMAADEPAGKPPVPDMEEVKRRSPIHMTSPVERRRDSRLFLYAGIHDGYTGSVPVTQSLQFYNKVVMDFDPDERGSLIPEDDMLQMVVSRHYKGSRKRTLGDRTVHYERCYRDLVKIVIFEGTHEMLPGVALDQVEPRRILAIGDSNGAAADGWVNQLVCIRFGDRVFNTSVAGNTIGFDNLGRASLNTLKNISSYMKEAADSLEGIDDIVIMLGTNDCKAVFRDSLELVPGNLEKLVLKIRSSEVFRRHTPEIYVVSPPPIGRDQILQEKYYGGSARVAWLQQRFREVAKLSGCRFIDVYTGLLPCHDQYAPDGIHLAAEGQRIIAAMISQSLE